MGRSDEYTKIYPVYRATRKSIGFDADHAERIWVGMHTMVELFLLSLFLLVCAVIGAVMYEHAETTFKVTGSTVLICAFIYVLGYLRTDLAEDIKEWR